MSRDEEHLRLLSIFHYVAGGIAGFLACIPVIYLIMGIAMLAGNFSGRGQGPPAILGLIFIMMPLVIMTLGWTLAICLIVSGRQLARRKCYKFCFAIACVSCLLMPYGTVLGVFTIIVLMRPSVKELFAGTTAE